jgi:hypothetical protein
MTKYGNMLEYTDRPVPFMRLYRNVLIIAMIIVMLLPAPVLGQNSVPLSSPPSYGTLQVSSVPSGAEVMLNGTFQGDTSLIIRNVTPGPYLVTLRLQEYQDREAYIVVKSHAITQMSLNLTPAESQTPGTTPIPTRAGIIDLTFCAALIAIVFLASRKLS